MKLLHWLEEGEKKKLYRYSSTNESSLLTVLQFCNPSLIYDGWWKFPFPIVCYYVLYCMLISISLAWYVNYMITRRLLYPLIHF